MKESLKVSVLLFLFLIATIYGDSPLPPPATYTVWSQNKQYCAEVDHIQKRIMVYRFVNNKKEFLWRINGWFHWVSLSNNGEYLAIPFKGYNLLPLNYKKYQIMLTLYKKGKITRTVKLYELIDDFSTLKRTVSHYSWGNYNGFTDKSFLFKTVNNKNFSLDLKSGVLSSKQ